MTTAAGGGILADLSESTILATGAGSPQTAAAIAALAVAAMPGTNAALLVLLASAVATLPTTLPATSGVLWLNGGVIQLS